MRDPRRAVTRRLSGDRCQQIARGHAESVAEAVDAEDGDDDPHDLDVLGVAESRGERLLEPGAGQPRRIHRHLVNDLDGGVRQRAETVVRTCNRERRQGVPAFSTQGAVRGLAHLGSDGDALGACPPGSRPGQSVPGALLAGAQVLANRYGCVGVAEVGHGGLRIGTAPDPSVARIEPGSFSRAGRRRKPRLS